MTRTAQLFGLAAWLGLTLAAAAVGAAASVNAAGFYADLVRPSWAPPAALFGPVWTILYALMGVAAWLTWRRRGLRGAALPLTLFVVQLAANALWSWLFFEWRSGAWAFAEILLLWSLIAATLLAFRRVSAIAAYLLLPYLAWVTFAAALTWAVWRANPHLLG